MSKDIEGMINQFVSNEDNIANLETMVINAIEFTPEPSGSQEIPWRRDEASPRD